MCRIWGSHGGEYLEDSHLNDSRAKLRGGNYISVQAYKPETLQAYCKRPKK
jgi:hypothetical protein